MKTSCIVTVPAAAMAALFLTGCTTFTDWQSQRDTADRENALLIEERFSRIEGRIEGVELEVQRVGNTTDSAGSARSRSEQELRARLEQLDARLRTVEAGREKDKKDIVDALSAKMAQIMAASQGSSSGGSAKKQPKRTHSNTGYEHEVKGGESLSAIASAYGVSVKSIIDNNEIKDPNRLRVGQKLFIPE